MILKHVLDIEIFKDDYAETVYQLATNLIGKIGSRKNLGLSIFSPFERVAKLAKPTSIPTTDPSFQGGCGISPISTEKQANHLPVGILRTGFFSCLGPSKERLERQFHPKSHIMRAYHYRQICKAQVAVLR
jgi:hypothetical protein